MPIKDEYFKMYNESLPQEIIKDAANKLLQLHNDSRKMLETVIEVDNLDKDKLPSFNKISSSSKDLVHMHMADYVSVISSNKLLSLLLLNLDLKLLTMLTNIVQVTPYPEEILTTLVKRDRKKP